MFKHSINSNSTIVDILREQASKQPEKMAYAFLREGKTIKDSWTYSQLNQRAIAIAATLESQIKSKSRVLLIYPAGLEFLAAFFGCLYADMIAIPAPAPEMFGKQRIVARLKAIIDDAKPDFLLTTSETYAQLDKLKEQIFSNCQPKILTTETLPVEQNYQLLKPAVFTDDIAYLQYTSGSTSTPKGVEITHKCLMANLGDAIAALGYNSNSIVANWMPHFHDAGLVGGLLRPLYAGISCYVMSPLALMKQPIRWLEIISNYRVTHSIGTNFIYDYCVSHAKPELCQNLNLSSWQVAGVGAEPIRHETLNSFVETFKPYGFEPSTFCPGYGLAESTLTLTAKSLNNRPLFLRVSAEALKKNQVLETSQIGEPVIVGCGSFIGNTKIAIVNTHTFTRCAVDEIGEIWVAGSSIAKGYWNRPDVTNQTFHAYITDTKEGPFLRTGDLGFIKDGELFVSGRLKDLIIRRGENYYPQDIEWIVEKSHPALRSAAGAAFSVEIEGTEQIVIVQEVERSAGKTLNSEEVIAAIRKAIAEELELPVYAIVLLKRGSIPKTSSGKIQRQACRAAFLNGSLDSIDAWRLNSESIREEIEPRTELELQLLQIWQKILGIAPISIKDNFFQLGGDSLKAANLVVLVEERLRIKIPLATVMEAPTIEKLAACLQQLNRKRNYNSLVAIRSQGSKRPFFYVDGLGANIVNYTNLERYLDPERPFYVLHPVGLNGDKFPHATIEEMASHYIKEIQTIQPQSPYLLGGYCMGAMVAFEMAQQLVKQEQIVLQLVMVEGVNPFNLAAKTVNNNEEFIKREIEIRNNLIEQGWNLGQVEIIIKIWKAERQAILNYMPKLYVGDVVYFSSEQSQHESRFNPMRQLGWAEFTNGDFEIETVPGAHLSMHLEPNVKILAERLNFHLERAAEKANSKVFLLKQSRLQQIQGDLARSRLKLQHFQAYLEK
ncbi:AMP-binding protein [Ancylothrix sp. C2]|uniref:AMP-binding protein n=1 Tax=Ancylothrix sp. D3o TaxID=2953691 RepID=UPI0021BACAE1|nr:AMP-binding protein [Ancylothrix sp. D3o]MCT7952798.1 AMP-binding protein [Ancylothrix sp. D3o]